MERSRLIGRSAATENPTPTPPYCHHCGGPLSKDMQTSRWTVAPLVRDSFSMIGTAVGGTASAFYGFNHGLYFFILSFTFGCLTSKMRIICYFYMILVSGLIFNLPSLLCCNSEDYILRRAEDLKAMPLVRRWVKGPMWLHFLVGTPPVIVFSSACAGLSGGAVPAFAQLVSSSYHAAACSSSLTRSSSQDDGMHKTRTSSPL